MNTSIRILLLAGLATTSLRAEGPFRNRDNKSDRDSAEGTYPVPYQLPTVAEVTEAIARIRTYHYVPKDGGPTSYREHL